MLTSELVDSGWSGHNVAEVGACKLEVVLAPGHAFTSNESQNNLKSDVKIEDLFQVASYVHWE